MEERVRQQEMSDEVVSLRGATKSYGGFTLGPVDLGIEPGYVVAVVGPNGSGKSTLFRLLMGLSQPDGGELSLFGRRHPQDEVEIKQRIGYVPEFSTGHGDMSARNLEAFVSRWYPRWNSGLYSGLLARLEIPPAQRFNKLSKGMQRRLAFALAVAREPEMLLLDEPTDGVDPFARRAMLGEVSRYLEGGSQTGERTVLRHARHGRGAPSGRLRGLPARRALPRPLREGRPAGRLALAVGGASAGGRPARPRRRRGWNPAAARHGLSREDGEGALRARHRGVVRSGPLDLEEILEHLMRRSEREDR